MVNRRLLFSPLVVLLVALVLLYHRLVLGEVFYWGLPSLQFYPWRDLAWDMLSQGTLPFWNTYNGAGAPLLANYQSALLYPPNWITYFLPLGWSMSVLAVLHLMLAGWGMWLFTGRLGLSELGRGMAAIGFALSGYLVARVGTYPIVFAAAWIPWVLWAALGILNGLGWRSVGWLGLAVGMQLLCGHAQTTWYSMLLLGAFCAWWSVQNRLWKVSRWLQLILGLIIGVAIAAAQIVPTAELLAQSQRSSGVDFEFAMNFSYAPARILNLFAANIFGTPADGSYATNGAYFEDAVYFGLIPLISAFVAILTWIMRTLRRRTRPDSMMTTPLWIVITLIAFIFALGRYTPIFPFLYENVPTFSMFQAPVRWHIWTVFALCVLAGIGADVWGRDRATLGRVRIALVAALGVMLVLLISPLVLPETALAEPVVSVMIRALFGMTLLIVAACVLSLRQPPATDEPKRTRWHMMVWAVIAVDLVVVGWGLNPTTSTAFYDPLPNESIVGRTFWLADDEEAIKFEQFLDFADYRLSPEEITAYRAAGLPNLNVVDRMASLNNFDPLLVGPYKQFLDQVNTNPINRDALLSAANVQVQLDASGQRRDLDIAPARVRLLPLGCYELLDPETELRSTWSPTQTVLLEPSETSDIAAASVETCSSMNGEVIVQLDSPNHILLTVTVEEEGWLVLADAYYPGWKGTVNDTDTEIYKANLAFRAVRIPAGTNQIEFRYEPMWPIPSVIVSIISVIIALLFVSIKSRRDGR
jgi:hypothetical protein